jgi:putative MATE family efflux protein
MKNSQTDLTKGPILSHLFRLALPIIGASFMQMTYSLADMIWLGRVGEDAVASVGVAGFYVWLGFSVLLITRIGAEVGVSQALGRKESYTALRFIRHSLFWAVVISLGYAMVSFVWAPQLISFFGITSTAVNHEGSVYLRIVSLGFLFTFVNPTFAGIYNGMGDSRSPFWYMTSGVVLNLVLDPILIFGWWIFPEMGVSGAAWATFMSQFLVFLIFAIRFLWVQEMVTLHLSQFRLDPGISKRIFRLGIPVAAESALFAVFAMFIARMVADYGAIAIAVQSIGGQIEAISWMTSTGFATALGSFTGQNFGAGNWLRIRQGYKYTLLIGTFLGLTVTAIFFLFGKSVFSVFLSDPEAQQLGAVYLYILAVSQVFMIYEITTRGAFNGIGLTIPPSLTGIVFTGLRIPMAWLLMGFSTYGLFGIWGAISLTSVFKGILLPVWFYMVLKHGGWNLPSSKKSRWIVLLPSRLRQNTVISKE